MARKSKKADCTLITFHRRGGKAVKVKRCHSRKLKGSHKSQCRARNPREAKTFRNMRFKKC